MVSIATEDILLEYGTNVILKNISFSINDGDKLGIVGVNGAGKSSLIKIIMGIIEPTSGKVYIAKDKKIAFLDQYLNFESEKSVIDSMLECFSDLIEREKELEHVHQKLLTSDDNELSARYSEMLESFTDDGGFEFRSRCISILNALGFDDRMHDLSVNSLSGGQKTRLALGRILYMPSDILILDEPTNHLDMQTLSWLEQRLSLMKKTIIVVSHDRYFLDKISNKILDIENKKAVIYNGNYTTYIEKKKKNREILQNHYDNQQKEIERIKAYIEQQKRWNRERNIIAAESREKMLDRMELIDKPENAPDEVRIRFPECSESGNDVICVKNLTKSFENKSLFEDLSFLIKRKDKVMILGPNGCGKSTLLKILTGNEKQSNGDFYFGYNVKTAYYDQENQNLNPDNTVLDELWESYDKLTMTQIRNTLALFCFKGDDVFKNVSDLSGGERSRLTLAKLVLAKSNLLILDEPTNHLDISTREILEEAISEYSGTVIAVSHDRYFIKKIASRILSFDSNSNIKDFSGTYEEFLYSEYLYQNNLNTLSSEKKEKDESSKNDYIKNKKNNSDIRKNKRRLESLKKEIPEAERSIEQVDLQIEENSTDHILLNELYNKKEELENKLLIMYEEFEQLEELLKE